jgi:N-carbamoyl-L-amino-acid hydrolase
MKRQPVDDSGAAATHARETHMRMPSGAGRDENTADGDIVLGCQVFADATAKILKGN